MNRFGYIALLLLISCSSNFPVLSKESSVHSNHIYSLTVKFISDGNNDKNILGVINTLPGSTELQTFSETTSGSVIRTVQVRYQQVDRIKFMQLKEDLQKIPGVMEVISS